MILLPGPDAYRQLLQNVRQKTFSMPPKIPSDQYCDGGIFPTLRPDFKLASGSKIFTVGSCFARNVEAVLRDQAFEVPPAAFTIPAEELPLPGPHLLNEYNAGTIGQRLEAAAGLFDYGDKGIEITEKGAIDLFLHIGSKPVTMERLHARRAEIRELYRELPSSDAVIITLGLVESWWDREDGCYLNRAPSQAWVKREPGRFEFHRMDVDDVFRKMDRAIEVLIGMGLQRIIITVSPIPVEATFMPESCPIANGYSKAVLRVCAEMLTKRYPQVFYFPSFEIVNSFGSIGFQEDNIHVKDWVIHHIMHYMLKTWWPFPPNRRRSTTPAGRRC